MVNYSASATALLALSSQVITAINAERSESVRRDGRERQGLRKLSGLDETDVQTECEQVIEGNPAVCVKVCVTVTSIKKGDETIEEYSEVKQEKCESGWESGGDWNGDTEWPTYSPTSITDSPTHSPMEWGGDEHDIVDWTDDGWKSYSKDNSWKCTPKPGKPSWSAPVDDEWKHPTWTPPAWSVDEEHYTTSKASKGGKSSRGGKGGYLTNTSTDHDPAWDAPAPEHDAWTGGARRLGNGKNNADRMLVWPFKSWAATPATPAPKAKEWAAAPDEPKWSGSGKGTAKSWSSPTPKKTEWTATPKKTEWTATSKPKLGKSNKDKAKVAAWPSPSGWKSSSMPSICEPSIVTPTPAASSPRPTLSPSKNPTLSPSKYPTFSPTTTLSPTTCGVRKWYFDGEKCKNDLEGDEYPNLQECCDENFPGKTCSFEDDCCEMRKWFVDEYSICNNGIPPGSNTVTFDTLADCCATPDIVSCTINFIDVCEETPTITATTSTVESTSSTVASTTSTVESFSTPPPSVIITPNPSSPMPSFGSTPTVSKEVTGPPTMGRS
ncbi:hypothetical protein ACHAW5_004960 [Stephanodiscus triporus]|uniref:Uncharacterized protein n=1 Tax=Stephanodiscus triporus TaxID=2934178 RepID=A0ABD3P3I8_9STRA